jgi:hypothetical protein
MNKDLKAYLDKEDSELRSIFRFPTSGPCEIDDLLNFIKLVREELNYTPEYNFIRMINNETGEVRQCDATDEGFNALCDIIDNEPYLEAVIFEGNTNYIRTLKIYLDQIKKLFKPKN